MSTGAATWWNRLVSSNTSGKRMDIPILSHVHRILPPRTVAAIVFPSSFNSLRKSHRLRLGQLLAGDQLNPSLKSVPMFSRLNRFSHRLVHRTQKTFNARTESCKLTTKSILKKCSFSTTKHRKSTWWKNWMIYRSRGKAWVMMPVKTTMRSITPISSMYHARLTLPSLTRSHNKKANLRSKSTTKFLKRTTSSNKMKKWTTSNRTKIMAMKTLWIKWCGTRSVTTRCRPSRIQFRTPSKMWMRTTKWAMRWTISLHKTIKITFLSLLRLLRNILSQALSSQTLHRLLMLKMW